MRSSVTKWRCHASAILAIISASAVSVCFAQSGGAGRLGAATARPQWNVEVVSQDLDYPWDIERAGERIFMTEKAGNIVMVDAGRQRRFPVHTSDPIVAEGGGGLLGMALSSDFQSSGLVFLYHSYQSRAGLTNKVIQARFDGKEWAEVKVLLAGIPGHRLYNGGRVALGPDGHLYVTTGWTENRERPQDLRSLAGKVLRMTVSGQIPADNPFPASYVYSYGHRNPQGLAWDPLGQLFSIEHGQLGHDEINQVKPGANYGWPLAEGREQRVGMEPAWVESGQETWAPSGAAFSGNFLLVSALGARGLLAVDPSTRTVRTVFSSGDRIRDVLPAGRDIYVITTNRSPRGEGPSKDRLLKLTPQL